LYAHCIYHNSRLFHSVLHHGMSIYPLHFTDLLKQKAFSLLCGRLFERKNYNSTNNNNNNNNNENSMTLPNDSIFPSVVRLHVRQSGF